MLHLKTSLSQVVPRTWEISVRYWSSYLIGVVSYKVSWWAVPSDHVPVPRTVLSNYGRHTTSQACRRLPDQLSEMTDSLSIGGLARLVHIVQPLVIPVKDSLLDEMCHVWVGVVDGGEVLPGGSVIEGTLISQSAGPLLSTTLQSSVIHQASSTLV